MPGPGTHTQNYEMEFATLTHSNIPVGNQETQLSFTQYCLGENFHCVNNGFHTEKKLKQEDSLEWERLELLKEGRLEGGAC
jgi:hypothetical protein